MNKKIIDQKAQGLLVKPDPGPVELLYKSAATANVTAIALHKNLNLFDAMGPRTISLQINS